MLIFRRCRPFAFFIPTIVITWTLVTYYLAVYKSPSMVRDELSERRKNEELLKVKIAEVEKAVKKQLEDNSKLLDLIKQSNRLDITTAAPPKPSTEGPTTTPTPKISSPTFISSSLSPQTDQGKRDPFLNAQIAVLVIACNRADAVKNHIKQLLNLRPSKEQFPVIVSQDCAHNLTRDAIKEFGSQITYMQHPDQSDITLPQKMKKFVGYYKLSRHYRWALNQTFFELGYENVIVTEDDLDLAPDFFEYFLAGYRLLKLDPTLWCVSAWNDHGKPDLIDLNRPELLHRTDFFGGLGWMLLKSLWLELYVDWPIRFWDDWMRHPNQRKGRVCIRPEIPRTYVNQFGKSGVSKGLYYEKHLKGLKLSTVRVNFTQMDLSYLLKDNYDEPFVVQVYNSTAVESHELFSGKLANGQPLPPAVRLTYTDQKSYKAIAKSIPILEDAKAGVPRMSYRGVVSLWFRGIRLYIAPPAGWTKYEETWT